MMTMKRMVLLDRDGTVIVEKRYLTDPAGIELISGAAQAIKKLRALGLPVALVTNQSVIGRGLCDRACVDQIHARLSALLAAEGTALDGIWLCPHAPDAGCECRKPKTGLLVDAARALGADLSRSFVVGDKASDIEAGRRAGAFTILVRTGYGEQGAAPDREVADLAEAADLVATRLEV
jgi:D-glycero-D-manno-heptose 1,7-bisphosphate phosphatase